MVALRRVRPLGSRRLALDHPSLMPQYVGQHVGLLFVYLLNICVVVDVSSANKVYVDGSLITGRKLDNKWRKVIR